MRIQASAHVRVGSSPGGRIERSHPPVTHRCDQHGEESKSNKDSGKKMAVGKLLGYAIQWNGSNRLDEYDAMKKLSPTG